MTTITADTIRSAIETIRYELAPSAIEALGVDASRACDVFGDALLEVYPNASVTVIRASVDASSMTARGELDDGEEVVIRRDHFGRTEVDTRDGSVGVSVVRDIEGDDQRVWERACALAE